MPGSHDVTLRRARLRQHRQGCTFHSPAASTPLRCPWLSALGKKKDPELSHDFDFHLAQDQHRIDRDKCFLAEFDSPELAYLN